MPSSEIIAIGTELLLGEIIDTNTHFIARRLREQGIDLFRTQVIGDNIERIAQAIREALQRADIIITTGGLGPTIDDPTREAVARAIDVETEFHTELWDQIVARVARYGRAASENQKRQAYIPKGGIAIENPVGTAPAFIIETRRNVIIALPGVPHEMETLMTTAIIPYLQKRFTLHAIIKVRILHTAGMGESSIDEQIGDLETRSNPTVGLSAHSGMVDIRITAKANNEAEADQMIAEIEREIYARLERVIFGKDDDTLEGITVSAAEKKNWSMACYESGIGCSLLNRLKNTGNPIFLGGVYSEIRPKDLVEETMAVGHAHRADATLGVCYYNEDGAQKITIILFTPVGKEERHLTYGGHPLYAPHWAANIALDFFRRTILST